MNEEIQGSNYKMKVEKLDDEEEFEAENVMDVIKAINDYL